MKDFVVEGDMTIDDVVARAFQLDRHMEYILADEVEKVALEARREFNQDAYSGTSQDEWVDLVLDGHKWLCHRSHIRALAMLASDKELEEVREYGKQLYAEELTDETMAYARMHMHVKKRVDAMVAETEQMKIGG